MEQINNDNIYVIDLGEINTAPEVIFELSSVLDKEESHNRRICLRLGKIDLNQAQLLSIKSLINGIDSNLSGIETKSEATEKTALSLGIIITNSNSEKADNVNDAMPYKTIEEFKEEQQTSGSSASDTEEAKAQEEETISADELSEESETIQNTEIVEEKIEAEEHQEESGNENQENQENQEDKEIKEEKQNNVEDELEVIFGSNPVESSIFEMEVPKEIYEEEKEGLTDIIVPEQEYTKEDLELESFPTKYIKQTIRSGQVINYDGNIVIIGDCHPGSEITASGDITVWGILSGIAHSGANGNEKARVRALKMNAIQLRIAGCYSRRPDSLNTVYIEKTNSFTPEEARIVNGEIVVFKIND